MVATGVITPRSEAYSPDQLMQALRRGEISVGIVVPADFERRRFDGREAVQVLVDGSVLHLDTGTAVDIAFDAHARLLRLRHGQMLVETAADPHRPARPFRRAPVRGGRPAGRPARRGADLHTGATAPGRRRAAAALEPDPAATSQACTTRR
ncbi:hypothetical protein G6F63_014843 [Rhizopus arrhizus]|nr:hypothetical protein G6F63_014843 [Rhizopus arrhizus]